MVKQIDLLGPLQRNLTPVLFVSHPHHWAGGYTRARERVERLWTRHPDRPLT